MKCDYCKKQVTKKVKFEDGTEQNFCEQCLRRNFETEKEHNNKN